MKCHKLALAVALTAAVGAVQAQANIQNAEVQLGDGPLGALNVGGGEPATGSGTTLLGLISADQGAMFDVEFAALGAGDTQVFNTRVREPGMAERRAPSDGWSGRVVVAQSRAPRPSARWRWASSSAGGGASRVGQPPRWVSAKVASASIQAGSSLRQGT